ncbi:unnamed protein product [Linum trigynum]|uniref:Uncharacterized protein n=1 Tax=Linum trigynum TaxID=586398 RepID=A0AAV2FVX3_9ROSI
MDSGYTVWIYHGKSSQSHSHLDNTSVGDDYFDDSLYGHVDEEDHVLDLLDEYQNFITSEVTSEDDFTGNGYEEFLKLLEKANSELYPSCAKYSKFSFVVKLLHLKVYNRWSNKSFDMLLNLLKDVFLEGNSVPNSYYESKSTLRSHGFGYVPIHACPYDCVLYWKENEFLEECPICKTSRWKVDDGKGEKVHWKFLRYFPLKPRLRRLFMSSKTASEMRWHKEKRNDDGEWLRHPADSKEWKDFDME